ncbi:hypothetical protein SAZ11_14085 [Streptomyces sp. FXJ1.4098]|nr:hypothetical protein [Streptomyces sp. FXJ1.4098]
MTELVAQLPEDRTYRTVQEVVSGLGLHPRT